jgi:RHS repeat-associated protein
VTGGSGPAPQLSFDTSTNHVSSNGYLYDAAGNVISDGSHSYTYDAEGNVVAVDGGATAKYVYDAFNNRVESQVGSTITDFVYDYAGRLIENEPEPANAADEGRIYWDGALLAYLGQDAAIYFEHQDWQGTTRMRTDYQGNIAAYFTSLPFGDSLTATVLAGDGGQEPHHFAKLTFDSETGTEHAVFRQYNNTAGRWMFPDPYLGSYDPSNPQTFNRYAYVLNNPLAYTDPSGRQCVPVGTAGAAECTATIAFEGAASAAAGSGSLGWVGAAGAFFSNPITAAILGGAIGVAELGHLFGWWGGSSFHGSLEPRPSALNVFKNTVCSAIPSGRTEGASGGVGGVGSIGGGGELVINYNSGQISAFGFGGVQIGWNGGASGSLFSGFVYGLNNSNSNYSGGFTGVNGGAGLGGFATSSSGGLTGGIAGLAPNGAVKVGGISLGGGLLGGFSGGITATNYSNPFQLGRFWAFNLADAFFYAARQLCNN